MDAQMVSGLTQEGWRSCGQPVFYSAFGTVRYHRGGETDMAGGGRRRGGVKQLAGVQSKVDSSHAGLINKMFLLILKMKVHELCISDVLACRS